MMGQVADVPDFTGPQQRRSRKSSRRPSESASACEVPAQCMTRIAKAKLQGIAQLWECAFPCFDATWVFADGPVERRRTARETNTCETVRWCAMEFSPLH